jgi:hypothetical protein
MVGRIDSLKGLEYSDMSGSVFTWNLERPWKRVSSTFKDSPCPGHIVLSSVNHPSLATPIPSAAVPGFAFSPSVAVILQSLFLGVCLPPDDLKAADTDCGRGSAEVSCRDRLNANSRMALMHYLRASHLCLHKFGAIRTSVSNKPIPAPLKAALTPFDVPLGTFSALPIPPEELAGL